MWSKEAAKRAALAALDKARGGNGKNLGEHVRDGDAGRRPDAELDIDGRRRRAADARDDGGDQAPAAAGRQQIAASGAPARPLVEGSGPCRPRGSADAAATDGWYEISCPACATRSPARSSTSPTAPCSAGSAARRRARGRRLRLGRGSAAAGSARGWLRLATGACAAADARPPPAAPSSRRRTCCRRSARSRSRRSRRTVPTRARRSCPASAKEVGDAVRASSTSGQLAKRVYEADGNFVARADEGACTAPSSKEFEKTADRRDRRAAPRARPALVKEWFASAASSSPRTAASSPRRSKITEYRRQGRTACP